MKPKRPARATVASAAPFNKQTTAAQLDVINACLQRALGAAGKLQFAKVDKVPKAPSPVEALRALRALLLNASCALHGCADAFRHHELVPRRWLPRSGLRRSGQGLRFRHTP